MTIKHYTSKAIKRFWSKIDVSANRNECWLWTKGIGTGGYGMFYFKGKTQAAHRIAYQLRFGDIPDTQKLYHHCGNVLCVNPDHLYLEDRYDYLDRFWEKVDKSKGDDKCWIWIAGLDSRGYGQFWLDGIDRKAHRISYILKNGDIPDDLIVCHHCDNPSCVNPNHLFLGTHQDNATDRDQKGRGASGECSGMSKLTWEQVREIRKRYIPRIVSQPKLAKEYGVTHTLIGYIVRNEIWKE